MKGRWEVSGMQNNRKDRKKSDLGAYKFNSFTINNKSKHYVNESKGWTTTQVVGFGF